MSKLVLAALAAFCACTAPQRPTDRPQIPPPSTAEAVTASVVDSTDRFTAARTVETPHYETKDLCWRLAWFGARDRTAGTMNMVAFPRWNPDLRFSSCYAEGGREMAVVDGMFIVIDPDVLHSICAAGLSIQLQGENGGSAVLAIPPHVARGLCEALAVRGLTIAED